MKSTILSLMLAGVGVVLMGTARAQYTPNFGTSIGLLNSVANSSTASQASKDAAATATQTAKELEKNKSLVSDRFRDDKEKSDGGTAKRPKDVFRKGHETPPEKQETVFINLKRIQWRYDRMIDDGCTLEQATAACDWIVAFILAHECVHVNQGPGMTLADREKEAYTEEQKVEDGALSDPNLDEDVRDEIEKFKNEAAVMILIIGLLNP